MTYEPLAAVAFRQRLLTHPGERQDVDYKASMPFRGEDSFSLKLIRHIHGMANAGGGWLIVGFLETPERGLVPDPAHSDAVCASYDPTGLTQQVDSSVARGQRALVTVHLEFNAGTELHYPIIQVEGFSRTPNVCRRDKVASDTGDKVLRQGAVYIRRPGAETVPVSTPQDWEDLVNRCVRLRRDEFLTEFRELFERLTAPMPPSPSSAEELTTWVNQMRARALGTRKAAMDDAD